jgi:CxxC motif-containing protein (DUF1111 family)
METTKTGLPRKRRPGAGRPPKHGEETRSIRVSLSIPTELITNISELQVIVALFAIPQRSCGEQLR